MTHDNQPSSCCKQRMVRTPEPKTMKDDPKNDNYPCQECGKPRTKAQGGTTFTVCDECWDKAFPPKAITKDVPEECSNNPEQPCGEKKQH